GVGKQDAAHDRPGVRTPAAGKARATERGGADGEAQPGDGAGRRRRRLRTGCGVRGAGHGAGSAGRQGHVDAGRQGRVRHRDHDHSGTTAGTTLLAADGRAASAFAASPAFKQTSNGYLGTSDGWTHLGADHTMDRHYASAPNGNLVQTARLDLNGTGQTHATL